MVRRVGRGSRKSIESHSGTGRAIRGIGGGRKRGIAQVTALEGAVVGASPLVITVVSSSFTPPLDPLFDLLSTIGVWWAPEAGSVSDLNERSRSFDMEVDDGATNFGGTPPTWWSDGNNWGNTPPVIETPNYFDWTYNLTGDHQHSIFLVVKPSAHVSDITANPRISIHTDGDGAGVFSLLREVGLYFPEAANIPSASFFMYSLSGSTGDDPNNGTYMTSSIHQWQSVCYTVGGDGSRKQVGYKNAVEQFALNKNFDLEIPADASGSVIFTRASPSPGMTGSFAHVIIWPYTLTPAQVELMHNYIITDEAMEGFLPPVGMAAPYSASGHLGVVSALTPFTMSWQNHADGADNIIVERSSSVGSVFEIVDTLDSDAIIYENDISGSFLYRVKAVSGSASSSYSNLVPIETVDTSFPVAGFGLFYDPRVSDNTTLVDIGPGSHDATYTGTPTVKSNPPRIEFEGSEFARAIDIPAIRYVSGAAADQQYSWFVVSNPGSVTNNQYVVDIDGNDHTILMGYLDNYYEYFVAADSIARTGTSMSVAIDEWQTVSYTYDGQINEQRGYRNGELAIGPLTKTLAGIAGVDSIFTLAANGTGPGGDFYTGSMGYVITFPKTLTAAEVRDVHNWIREFGGFSMLPEATSSWAPMDTTGLLSVWAPRSNILGQVLVDTFGGFNMQLGSNEFSPDANDPAWQESPPALVYGGNDYCQRAATKTNPRSAAGEVSYTVVFKLDTDQAGFIFGSWYSVSNYPFWAYYNGPITPWLDWRSLISDSSWTDRYDGGEGMTAIGTSAWHTIQWSHKDAINSTLCMFDGVLVETANHSGLVNYNAATRYTLGTHPKLYSNSIIGQIGPTLLYSSWKSEAELQAIHNNIANDFPSFGLSIV
jgi:hypothetical protein